MFQAHFELLELFLSRRDDAVERIQTLLNAQRQPLDYLRDGALLSALVEDGFFELPGLTHAHSRLRGQLEAAHWARGFKPRALPGLHNGLIDPGEMMVRAFHLWQQTRWPGRAGRLRYAHTLFNLYLLRSLELLSMRVWDDGLDDAGDRLSRVQTVLDRLWSRSPADQPALIRDARWLIPLAQSPATDDLGAYLQIAALIAETLPADDRVAIHKANVRLAAGHLRSQIRHHSTKRGVSLDDNDVVLETRSSNALDYALLIQDLVPLLAAYDAACDHRDAQTRHELADAICQGFSPDPDLFVNRVELLGAYSMIEQLFITTDAGGARYSAMGQRHVASLDEYARLIGRVAKPLLEDCPRFRPVDGRYSPFGVLYGFSSDLIEHMAFKTLMPDAVTRFSLEDVFTAGDVDKRAWVNGWRRLPHLAPQVARQFDYPQSFAEEIFGRLEASLRTRASGDRATAARPTGRIVVVSDGDPRRSMAIAPASYETTQLLSDRREGRCILSYNTSDGWVAIRKTILTEALAAGTDACVTGLPASMIDVLKLMCPHLV